MTSDPAKRPLYPQAPETSVKRLRAGATQKGVCHKEHPLKEYKNLCQINKLAQMWAVTLKKSVQEK